MSNVIKLSVDLRDAFDQIEEAYEFMLAYAAQGRPREEGSDGGSQIRGYLQRYRAALDSVELSVPLILSDQSPGKAFAEQFVRDTQIMKSILDLLLAQPSISSDMIDNTNGLISVRAFLTGVFFIDQVVLPTRTAT